MRDDENHPFIMPSSMGLDYSEFQTTPDIMKSEHEINTNLSQIMEQAKSLKKTDTLDKKEQDIVQEYIEVSQQPQIQEQNNDVVNNYVEASPQTTQSQSFGQPINQNNGIGPVGQNSLGSAENSMSTNPRPSMSSGGRRR